MAFLSDRDGFWRTYRLDVNYGFVSAHTETDIPESHPAFSPTGSNILAVREEDEASNIYRIDYGEYTPLTATGDFNGHPAGGPVWWAPELAIHPTCEGE